MTGVRLLVLLAALAAGEASAQGTPRAWTVLQPGAVRIGERSLLRAEAAVPAGSAVTWAPPDSGGAFSWGEARVGRTRALAGGRMDTAWVEIPLQAFALGVLPVPGIGFQVREAPASQQLTAGRTPTARLIVLPMISPADSQATLKPVRGPLRAPWWERVPWLWVAGGLLLAAALILLVRRLRRRRAAAAPATAPSRSPAEIALAALAELRAERLPESGRMAEHAFRLGQILRRYLEATTRTTKPGHTTPELVRSLADAGLPADDRQRLTGLLRIWDRVKFARAPLTVEEAARSEQAVESFVRRVHAQPPIEPQQGAA